MSVYVEKKKWNWNMEEEDEEEVNATMADEKDKLVSTSDKNEEEVNTNEVKMDEKRVSDNDVINIELEAGKVITRIEQSGENPVEGGGMAWNNPSGFLINPKSPETILTLIQDLIIHENIPQVGEDGTIDGHINQIINLPVLTEAAKLAIKINSISAYAVNLPCSHAQNLASRLTADCTRWISYLFRFIDCASCYHDDPWEGLVRVTKLAIYNKYPKYKDEGFMALASAPPIIYSSAAADLQIVQHLCRQLSIPLSCVRLIPQNTMFGPRQSIDISALEKRLIEDNQSNSVTPLLVLAQVGSTTIGHSDNITRLREICDKHNVWLHLHGHSLAALALNNAPIDLPLKIADSITLPLGLWLGIPSLPVVTLYRIDSKDDSKDKQDKANRECPISYSMSTTLSRRLPTLPMWSALQVLGRSGIQNRLKQCFQIIEELYNKIKKFDNIKFISQLPGGKFTINEIMTKPLSAPQLFESVASCLVFQYIPYARDGQLCERNPSYYDQFNFWLGQILQRDIENVPIQICEVEHQGLAIKICCLENVTVPPSLKDIDDVVSCLGQQIEILNATVEHKETFKRMVDENDSLVYVPLNGWAGLGGVRYAPPTWAQIKTAQTKIELDKLNDQLVKALRNTDAAFSFGKGADGLACVRFGMVTQDSDLAKLLSLVLQVGREVEASSKLLDTVSEVVKRGIETAQTDLERENAEKLWQEGILRHVPVVGTFVNWWSPPVKESGVRGRRLILELGVLESTENIYQFHYQRNNDTMSNGSGARTPPQPLVQTPVGNISQSHSRSSSHSSSQSNKAISHSNSSILQSQLKDELNTSKS